MKEVHEAPLTRGARMRPAPDMLKLTAVERQRPGEKGKQVRASEQGLKAWEEKMRVSLRNIVQEGRQTEPVQSGKPGITNMRSNQILLEALSKSDWDTKLQAQGVAIEPKAVAWLHGRLADIAKKALITPNDYNPVARTFNEVLSRYPKVDSTTLQASEVGGHGGVGYTYVASRQQHYGRFITLIDPTGREHPFNRGESSPEIAEYTRNINRYYRERYVNESIAHFASIDPQWRPDANVYQFYWNNYQSQTLTANEVQALREGSVVNGWTCSEREVFPVDHNAYYTDKGTKIPTLDLSSYTPLSREQHLEAFPDHPPLNSPTPAYNCMSKLIQEEAWVLPENGAIQAIITDNDYFVVEPNDVKANDMVVYYDSGADSFHIGIVNDLGSGPFVESKPGEWGDIEHGVFDPGILAKFGTPTIYRTLREGGNFLRQTAPEE